MSTALTLTGKERQTAMVEAVKDQMDAITALMRSAMVSGIDYGVIPGTGSKPTLLKPGAEKLCMLFKLSTKVEKVVRDFPGGHREYEITVTLARRDEDGEFFGEGVGTCSTMESKYRYRNAQRKCPSCGKAAIIRQKPEKGGGWICVGNDKGGCWAKFAPDDPDVAGQQAGKVDNPDIADAYNTVLKMAKKRALVDAVLTATAASQIFTQDLEDMHGEPEHHDESAAIHNAKPLPNRPVKPVEQPPPEPIISLEEKKTLIGLSARTESWELAQTTLLRHFKVAAIKDIPARCFQEAATMLRNMAVSAPKTPPPTRNEDADVPEDELADAPI